MWLAEPFSKGQAWVDLLLMANHTETYFYKRGNKVIVERGEIGRSIIELAERWKWSRGKVKRFLNDLENEMQIIQQNNAVTTKITIVNYDAYQQAEKRKIGEPETVQQTDSKRYNRRNENDTTDGREMVQQKNAVTNGQSGDSKIKKQQAVQQTDSKRYNRRTADDTTDGQQTVQQTDTYKNVKNNKNEKNDKEKLNVRAFYQKEFEKAKQHQDWKIKNGYFRFVGRIWNMPEYENDIGRPAEHILKLPAQITFKQYCQLIAEATKRQVSVLDMLDVMINDAKYTKGKNSIYLTLRNWVKREPIKGTNLG